MLEEKQEYFDSIPFKIKEHIMCKFLFEDIIDKAAFKSFFRVGREFDSNFVYQVAFGFMPRMFKNTKDDRFILEEEGDVTEIYFIISGDWGVGYNSFQGNISRFNYNAEFDLPGTEDLDEKGIMIAQKRVNYGYIGDYYVFASKRSQFSYIALSTVKAFALPKKFMFKQIFKKFPGLHSEMLAESFSRYIKEFRKPCGKKRLETINNINERNAYSKISADNQRTNPMHTIKKALDKWGMAALRLTRSNSRAKIFEKQDELQDYKEQLDVLNEKANVMFDQMKAINKLVNNKIQDIECAVTKSEGIFVDEINTLIRSKAELSKIERKNMVSQTR